MQEQEKGFFNNLVDGFKTWLKETLEGITKFGSIPIMYNETCITANYEYNKRLEKGVKKFTFKARNGTVNISFNQGQSSLNYVLLNNGVSWSEDRLNTRDDFMIYFQSPSANTVLEIIVWR